MPVQLQAVKAADQAGSVAASHVCAGVVTPPGTGYGGFFHVSAHPHTPPPCPRIPSHPPHIRTNALYEFTCPHMSGMNLNQPGCFCACTDVAGELIQRTSRDTGAKPPPPIRDCSQKKKSKKKSKKNWRAPRSAAGRRLLTPSGPVYHRPLVGTVVELADYPWKHRGFCLGQLRCPPPRTDETPRPRRTRMP